MRYGPFSGLAGAFVLLVAWFYFRATGRLPGEFPKLNFLGGLILVMLSGEFSSLWLARARRAEGVGLYLDQRLEYLTHQYYLLRLSHDRLEQDLVARPMAMRDALSALHSINDAGDEYGPAIVDEYKLMGGEGLLRLLAQYCQIEVAALYSATADAFVTQPVALLGQSAQNGQFHVEDSLVQHALNKNCLAHIGNSPSTDAKASRYVIVAPLSAFSGKRLGLLAVERIPFFALHEETLQTLNLLLGYYTDGLITRQLAAPVLAAIPSCPDEFAAEVQRLCRVYRESRISSVFVAFEFRINNEEDMAAHIRRQKRSLDVNWLIEEEEEQKHRVLITLMPLAGEAAAEGYLARIEGWLNQTYGRTLEQTGIFPHILHIQDESPVILLQRLLSICHVSGKISSLRASA